MLIVKIGGGASLDYEAIASDLAQRSGPMVLVHGANAQRDALTRALDQPKRVVTSLSGYDSVYADEASLDVMLMAYAGLANKRLCASLNRQGVKAIGLTGIDGGLIRGRRNPGIKTMVDGKKVLLRDLSGKPETINTQLIQLLLDGGYVPLITVPILDEQGVPVSSENDDIVVLLHASLNASQIVQLIEAPGLLADPADPDSLIKDLNREELSLWQDRSSGRMKRKLLSLTKLFGHGTPQVFIADGRIGSPVSAALAGRGTCIH